MERVWSIVLFLVTNQEIKDKWKKSLFCSKTRPRPKPSKIPFIHFIQPPPLAKLPPLYSLQLHVINIYFINVLQTSTTSRFYSYLTHFSYKLCPLTSFPFFFTFTINNILGDDNQTQQQEARYTVLFNVNH